MAVVRLDNLSKIYASGETPAVNRVSLTVEDGEFMVFLGPSGCGKSTTLRMIAGLESITDGNLLIDAQRVNQVPAKDRDIAMVFQSYALYPHMNVRDNLAFGLRRRGTPRAEIDTRVRQTAETLGLTPFLERKPHALSGGQRQRVALGRAIVRDPKVFLLDEPLSNLDAALRVSTRAELIRQHRRLGTTMIYVTHDQIEAMTMGSRICIMNGGHVAQIGEPMEVYRNPADTFVAKFLGSPGMNLLPAERAGDSRLRIGRSDLKLANGHGAGLGARAVLGIRPEDIYLEEALPPGLPAETLEARVDTVEPLGAETLLSFFIEGHQEALVARLGRDVRVRAGDNVPLAVDMQAVRLFDPQSGKAIHMTHTMGT